MSRGLVLIVEDERSLCAALARFLQGRGHDTVQASSCAEAERAFRTRKPDVTLTDYRLPDGTALDLLPRLRGLDKDVPVVLLTGQVSVELAVRAIKEGAEQFLTKPVDLPALGIVIDRLIEARRTREGERALREREGRGTPDPFAGGSAAIHRLHEQARRVAESEGPVLVLGETGSGKGVLMRWIHARSSRASERFVDLNCAGLSRELLENELFGHERGAFTGAQAAKPGLLEIADKGTLFLDEIGDVDPSVQPRLLKVLEEKRFRRLGDVKDRTVDVRMVAATHHDLESAVRAKRFREDLYYRISVLHLRVPPLRERPEDIPGLARHLLAPGVELSADALQALRDYAWPGNVRELRNILERAQVLAGKLLLTAADLQLGGPATMTDEALTLDQVERRHIERVLLREKGSVKSAARSLGIARSSLYRRLQRHGLLISTRDDPN